MMSQGASKVNISLVVEGSEAQHAVRALHAEFFENGAVAVKPTNGSMAAAARR